MAALTAVADIWSPVNPGPPSGHAVSPDGTSLAWFRTGLAGGPPLLLIHGATADHTTFRVVGPLFAATHDVFAMDRRGRGASGDRTGRHPYAIEREYEDVATVLETIAAETGRQVDVVGHSYGGRVALGRRAAHDQHAPARRLRERAGP